jgi:hypothetical protein
METVQPCLACGAVPSARRYAARLLDVPAPGTSLASSRLLVLRTPLVSRLRPSRSSSQTAQS